MEALREVPRAAPISGYACRKFGPLARVSTGAMALALATGAAAQQPPGVADEDIIVTGYRASLANAIAEKKNSDLIVESISAILDCSSLFSGKQNSSLLMSLRIILLRALPDSKTSSCFRNASERRTCDK